ncbi:alpha/beta hydrolase [Jatrophihabitans sp. YIM 134969]
MPHTLISTTTEDGVRLAGRAWEPGFVKDVNEFADGDHAEVTPDAPTYVVGHGFTGSTSAGRVLDICERLAGRGARVVAFDFRGHGDSGGGSTLGDVETRDLAAAVAYARARWDGPVVAAGWSMGGSVVLRHAGLGGDADAVVSVSSPGIWYERHTRAMRIVHWAAETHRGWALCRLLTGTRLTSGWERLPESPVEVAAAIAPRPLLVVHGDADTYFPVRHGEALAAAAPHATFWLEPGMGHAETATTPELVDRIDVWVRAALAGRPPYGRSGAAHRVTMTG